MAFLVDLRQWLEKVREMNELKTILDADWNEEIGCITNLNSRVEGCSALLFDRIKGYPQGYRLATSLLTTPSRIDLTFNLPAADSNLERVRAFRQRLPQWEREMANYPWRVTGSGPVTENVQHGSDVDLFRFPSPKWNRDDGGRYLGTGCVVITKDPEKGVVNLGCYRNQVHDNRTLGLSYSPGKHGRAHIERYHQKGERAPVAVSLGHDPLLFALAGAPVIHRSLSEYHLAGAIRQAPVDVIMEEVTGLPVPASSEIVVAGWVRPDSNALEGPFGEYLGYYGAMAEPAPVIEVERIYHRRDPIVLGAPPSRPPGEYGHYVDLINSANLHNFLESSGVTDVRGVWVSKEGRHYMVTVSIKQRYAGHAKQAALLVSQFRPAAMTGRFIIVVDDDIDPTDPHDVLWSMCTRCNPQTDIDIIDGLRSNPLDPMIRKPTEHYSGSRAFVKACKPFEWIEDFPKEIKVSRDLASQVRTKYGQLLGWTG